MSAKLTKAAPPPSASQAEEIWKLTYERDVWKSKSDMHQKAAAGLCVAEAHALTAGAEIANHPISHVSP